MNLSKERALHALLIEKNKTEAAKACGITQRTMSNYLKDPEFVAAYNAAFNLMISKATRKAQQAMESAVDVLREVAENENETGATRATAARSLLEYGLRLSEISNVDKDNQEHTESDNNTNEETSSNEIDVDKCVKHFENYVDDELDLAIIMSEWHNCELNLGRFTLKILDAVVPMGKTYALFLGKEKAGEIFHRIGDMSEYVKKRYAEVKKTKNH